MTVDCMIEDQRWSRIGLETMAQTAAEAVFAHLELQGAFEISLLACNDVRIAELNADFRGKPKATNVLSWPSEERAPEVAGDMPDLEGLDEELGDIAIAYETCAREAEEAGKTMADHCTHLLVHGTLHLLGFDHETDEDAALMEGHETDILAKLGIADPYQDH